MKNVIPSSGMSLTRIFDRSSLLSAQNESSLIQKEEMITIQSTGRRYLLFSIIYVLWIVYISLLHVWIHPQDFQIPFWTNLILFMLLVFSLLFMKVRKIYSVWMISILVVLFVLNTLICTISLDEIDKDMDTDYLILNYCPIYVITIILSSTIPFHFKTQIATNCVILGIIGTFYALALPNIQYLPPLMFIHILVVFSTIIPVQHSSYRHERYKDHRPVEPAHDPYNPPSKFYHDDSENGGAMQEIEHTVNTIEGVVYDLKNMTRDPEWFHKTELKDAYQKLRKIQDRLQKNRNIYENFWCFPEHCDETDKSYIEQFWMSDNFLTSSLNNIHSNSRHTSQLPHPSPNPEKIVSKANETIRKYIKNFGVKWNNDPFPLIDVLDDHPMAFIGKSAVEHFCWEMLDDINMKKFVRFLEQLQVKYQRNPFHNETHGIDVLHAFAYFMNNSTMKDWLQSVDILACIVATLGHDVGHVGLSNRFLVNTQHKFALKYNDISVSENMHASIVWTLMQQEDTRFLEKNIMHEWELWIRKIIIEMILATDMEKHFPIIGSFRTSLSKMGESKLDKTHTKLLLLQIAIKAADLSHAAKKLKLHVKWTKELTNELFYQGDMEKDMGIVVSAYCDRNAWAIHKHQATFLKTIVIPLYSSFNFFLNSDMIEVSCLHRLSKNLMYWKRQVTKRSSTRIPSTGSRLPVSIEEEKTKYKKRRSLTSKEVQMLQESADSSDGQWMGKSEIQKGHPNRVNNMSIGSAAELIVEDTF